MFAFEFVCELSLRSNEENSTVQKMKMRTNQKHRQSLEVQVKRKALIITHLILKKAAPTSDIQTAVKNLKEILQKNGKEKLTMNITVLSNMLSSK